MIALVVATVNVSDGYTDVDVDISVVAVNVVRIDVVTVVSSVVTDANGVEVVGNKLVSLVEMGKQLV